MDQVLQHWQTKLKAITPEPKEKIAFNKWHEILWAKVWWKWNPAQLIYIHVGIDLKGVFSRNANMELFLSMEIVALHGGILEKYFIEFKTKIFTNTFLSDPGSIIVISCQSLSHCFAVNFAKVEICICHICYMNCVMRAPLILLRS